MVRIGRDRQNPRILWGGEPQGKWRCDRLDCVEFCAAGRERWVEIDPGSVICKIPLGIEGIAPLGRTREEK